MNWKSIKKAIFQEVKEVLQNGDPKFTEEEILEGIDLMKKVLYHNVGELDLNGLHNRIIPALEEALHTKYGDYNPVETITYRIDGYLKKICIIGLNSSFTDVDKKTTIPLFKKARLNSALTNQPSGGFPQLEIELLKEYIDESEYLYHICYTSLTRNKVHSAPDWPRAEITTRLKSVLITYVYAALKYKDQIKILPNPLGKIKVEENSNIFHYHQKMFYDFITHSKSATNAKTEVLNSYIIHTLFESNTGLKIENLKTQINDFFKINMNSDDINRITIKLIEQDKKLIYHEYDNTIVTLKDDERYRIKEIKQNYVDEYKDFLKSLNDILLNYGIPSEENKILNELYNLFTESYNIDILEALDKAHLEDKGEVDIFKFFKNTLKSILIDEEDVINSLLEDIMLLCSESNILIRTCSSKVFAKMLCDNRLQNYMNLKNRKVYLDTQVILHILCLGYDDNHDNSYDNSYFKISKAFIEKVMNDETISLHFSNLYMYEVIYQLKKALLLIPFEEFISGRLSRNVFYNYYYELKSSGKSKDEGTFSDFMYEHFFLREEDAYDKYFEKKCFGTIRDILKNEYNINVEELPRYSDEDRNATASLLREIIEFKTNRTEKRYNVLNNDALMAIHLSDDEVHENEPYFITWDSIFTPFRKRYLETYKRLAPLSWHLFTPSKLLNHLSLIKMQIPNNISPDILSIIDTTNIHNNTRTLIDVMNKFFLVQGMNKEKSRKSIKILKDIFNEYEFDFPIDSEFENKEGERLTVAFEDILDKIEAYFSNSENTNYKIDDYRLLISEENYFEKLTKLIVREVKSFLENNIFNDELFKEVEKMISDNRDKKLEDK